MKTTSILLSRVLTVAMGLATVPGFAKPSVSIAPLADAPDDALIAFATSDLRQALNKTGHPSVNAAGAMQIRFDRFAPGMGPRGRR
jgi:hypothetical protein